MPDSQEILWTALPNGFKAIDGQWFFKLSVFITPRLKSTTPETRHTLSNYIDFLNWPPNNLRFLVEFDKTDPTDTAASGFSYSNIAPVSSIEPGLWSRLFNSGTYVRCFEAVNPLTRQIHSIPLAPIDSFIRETYLEGLGDSETARNLPTITSLAKSLRPAGVNLFKNITNEVNRPSDLIDHTVLKQSLNKIFDEYKYFPNKLMFDNREFDAFIGARPGGRPLNLDPAIISFATDSAENRETFRTLMCFMQVENFHRHPPQAEVVRSMFLARPRPDFHEIVSSLGQYPKLLRQLGLVFDLEVPTNESWELFRSAYNEGKIRVKPILPEGAAFSLSTNNKCPWTIFSISRFSPLSINERAFTDPSPTSVFNVSNLPAKEGLLKDGMLKMRSNLDADDNPILSILYDIDGSSLSTINSANNAQNINQSRNEDRATTQGLPTLRSNGITLAKNGRDQQLHNSFKDSSDQNDRMTIDENVYLFAEDLIRGFRIDALDYRQRRWYSLCKRNGKYTFLDRSNANRRIDDSDRYSGAQIFDFQAEADPNKEEGFVVMAATSKTGENADNRNRQGEGENAGELNPSWNSNESLNLHESICTWDGWGLSVPRPGKLLKKDINVVNIASPTNSPPGARRERVEGRNIVTICTSEALKIHQEDGTERFVDVGDTIIITEVDDNSFCGVFTIERKINNNTFTYLQNGPEAVSGNGVVSEDPTDNPINLADSNFPLEVKFKAFNGSFPTLRYGVNYRLRARAVDLSGNSIEFNETALSDLGSYDTDPTKKESVTESLYYSRSEPISSPSLVLKERDESEPLLGGENLLIEGESTEQLVVRSRESSDISVREFTERHVVPPKVSQLMAETIGMFDSSGRPDPDKYNQILEFDEPLFPEGEEQTPKPSPLTIRYLSDPFAAGASVVNIPSLSSGAVERVQFRNESGLNWPYVQPFVIRVNRIEAGIAASHNISERNGRLLLQINLPPAEIVKMRLSCYITADNLSKMGLWQWFIRRYSGSIINTIRNEATIGKVWQLTPWQEIPLIHAVQKPLGAPNMTNSLRVAKRIIISQKASTSPPSIVVSYVQRDIGDTYAVIVDSNPKSPNYGTSAMMISGKSTSVIDVFAQWTEPLDDENDEDGPRDGSIPDRGQVEFPKRHVFQMPVEYGEQYALPLEFGIDCNIDYPADYEIGGISGAVREDNIVTIKTVNASYGPVNHGYKTGDYVVITGMDNDSFNGEFKINVDPSKPTLFTYEQPGPDASSGGGKVQSRARLRQRHEFGDTKHRNVTYSAVATSRFKDNYPEGTDILLEGAAKTINVPGSARPAAPKVLYVIPTFKWVSSRGSKTRKGGLRVYMERPWYSSGEGELLGVVLWKYNIGNPYVPKEIKPFTTQWGQDPIWRTSQTVDRLMPSLARFKKSVKNQSDLTIAEIPASANNNFSVAGHEVKYDQDRKLWLCDIEIESGRTYFPFIRLALARYQPNSIPDAHLSPIVLADFIQLTPERAATLFYSTINHRLTLQVTGPIHYDRKFLRSEAKNLFVATLQSRVKNSEDEFAWINVKILQMTLITGKGIKVSDSVWQAKFTNKPNDNYDYRIILNEYEEFPLPGTQIPKNYKRRLKEVPNRIVYSDIIAINYS